MNLTFLKNEDDYINYGKQKPVRIIINSKVKFICSICNEESIKVFKSLKYPFICKHCTNRAGQLNPVVKEKKKNTCKIRYGVENCFQSLEKIEKAKQTKLKLHDDVNWNNRYKARKTCKQKYGYEFPSQVPEFKEKMKTTCELNYGYDNYYKTPECRKKMYDAIVAKRGYAGSKKEHLLQEYIKSFYNDIILFDDRNIIEGYELDIYLPKINLAFEFDGTYWHADPLYYSADYRVRLKRNQTAQELWNIDKKKDLLCEQHNITLVRIKEHEWNLFEDIIKQAIKHIIEKKENQNG